MKVYVALFLLLLPLGGCWDRIELDQLAYVISIGVDQGEGDWIEVTYQIANPEAMMDGVDQENASEIVTVSAPDFRSARNMAIAFVTKEIVFTHTEALVVSEEIARQNVLIPLVDAAIRDRQLNRSMNVIVVRETAAEFIRHNRPTLEIKPHKYFDLMARRWEDTGLVPQSTVDEMFNHFEGNQGMFLATYGTTQTLEAEAKENEDQYLPGQLDKQGGNPTQMIGSAVMKEGVMIGTLDGEQTRMALLLRPQNDTREMIVTFSDPLDNDHHITTRLLYEQPSHVHIATEKTYPTIHAHMLLSFEVLAIPSLINYVEDLKKQQILKRHIKKEIEEITHELIDRTQTDFQAEPFLWWQVAKKNFLTLQEYEDYKWTDNYPNADVTVTVDVELKDFGKHLGRVNKGERKE